MIFSPMSVPGTLRAVRIESPVSESELKRRGLPAELDRIVLCGSEGGQYGLLTLVHQLLGACDDTKVAVSNVWSAARHSELVAMGFLRTAEKLLVGRPPVSIPVMVKTWSAERFYFWSSEGMSGEPSDISPIRKGTTLDEVIWALAGPVGGFVHFDPLHPEVEFVGRSDFVKKHWTRLGVELLA